MIRSHDAADSARWAVYAILIAVAVGNMSGRILAVNSTDNARLEAHRIRERLTAFRQSVAAQGVSGEELERQVAEREAELQEALRLQRPFLSSNDRSRWMTVRSLVEHGTYEIDEIVEARDSLSAVREDRDQDALARHLIGHSRSLRVGRSSRGGQNDRDEDRGQHSETEAT